jgi:hypothetical protein
MPVTYLIDKAEGLIRTRCVGDVTLEEVADHFRELVENPDCPERLDVLLDLSEMITLPESEQLRSVGSIISRVLPKVHFGACAIVATRDALYGMIRVFEVFAEHQFASLKIFRDHSEAEMWLHSVRSAHQNN